MLHSILSFLLWTVLFLHPSFFPIFLLFSLFPVIFSLYILCTILIWFLIFRPLLHWLSASLLRHNEVNFHFSLSLCTSYLSLSYSKMLNKLHYKLKSLVGKLLYFIFTAYFLSLSSLSSFTLYISHSGSYGYLILFKFCTVIILIFAVHLQLKYHALFCSQAFINSFILLIHTFIHSPY